MQALNKFLILLYLFGPALVYAEKLNCIIDRGFVPPQIFVSDDCRHTYVKPRYLKSYKLKSLENNCKSSDEFSFELKKVFESDYYDIDEIDLTGVAEGSSVFDLDDMPLLRSDLYMYLPFQVNLNDLKIITDEQVDGVRIAQDVNASHIKIAFNIGAPEHISVSFKSKKLCSGSVGSHFLKVMNLSFKHTALLGTGWYEFNSTLRIIK